MHEQVETNVNLFWYTGWPDYITSPKFSMRWEGKLTPTETGTYRFHFKSFGPKRIFLDGQELSNNCVSTEAWTVPVDLQAGKEYDFACETANYTLGAFRAQLFWKTPGNFRPGKNRRAATANAFRLSARRKSVGGFLDRTNRSGRPDHHRRCAHRQDSASGQGWLHHSHGPLHPIRG